ncbi:unnamed protein product [Cylindrotheca closterium]|uniref:HSF-type DNA-binding domain-containing protein n=1 Tax=Cylindrotheca closterium TaxID=2856 RepID=A0AAD2CP18_9STRA|nr:unnamed protein product [Cylindrotheca closterium]
MDGNDRQATNTPPNLAALQEGVQEPRAHESQVMNKTASQDHSVIPASDAGNQTETDKKIGEATTSSTSRTASASSNEAQSDRPTVQFPWRLHELLTEAETNGNDAIISWIPGTNNAFKVKNKEKFTNEILPEYFNATKYKSFQRNLNLWGFESITEGPNKGGCQHPIFIRGDREKCHYMIRQKVKGQKQKQQESLASLSAKDAASASLRRSSMSLLTSGFPGSTNFQATTGGTSLPTLDGHELSFCEKLHRVLALTELQGFMHWTGDGRAIAIVNPYQFNGIAVNNFFPNMTLPVFLAELEGYGFQKVSHGGFQDCYYHDMMMQGCQHLCKYIASPNEARRFISKDPISDLNKGQTRNVNQMGNHSNQGIPTSDASSLQQLFQLQATGGLGNILSSQVPRTTQDSLSNSLALLSAGQSSMPNHALNPTLQFLGNNMQGNRSSTIASYLTELQLRQHQQHQQQGSGGSNGSGGAGDGGLGGITRGAQV